MRSANPKAWQVRAYNQATESENKIHDDSVARRYGFRGGLVPGVTVYAYLVHPAIAAWGDDWLARGTANAVFRKPVYDGDSVQIGLDVGSPDEYRVEAIDPEGTRCASGVVALPERPGEPPVRRGDAPVPDQAARPDATRAALEVLRDRGLGSLRVEWRGESPYDRYTRSLDDMPDAVRPDVGGAANPVFTLGLANWILAANVRLGPWIHVESDVQNHALVPLGSALQVEGRVVDLFERGGHEFADLEVAAFLERDRPALQVRHRAIYKLREAEPS